MVAKNGETFFDTAKLTDICGLASIVHQWHCALHRNPIKCALLSENGSIQGEPDMFKVQRCIQGGQINLIDVIRGMITFFCTQKALTKKLDESFAHKRGVSPYLSEIVHCGSDIGLLLYRLLHYVMETEKIQWFGKDVYRLTFKEDLPMCINSALSRHDHADEIFVDILEGPRGGLNAMQEYFYYPALLMAESYGAHPNGMPTIRHLPKEPRMYPAKAKYPSVSKQPKSYEKRKAEREAALAGLPLRPTAIELVLPKKAEEKVSPAILTDENALTGSIVLDKTLVLFVTPTELCDLRKVSQYTRALVQTYFSEPVQWAVDITGIIAKYLKEERGKFHLLLETWGYEDVEKENALVESRKRKNE